MESLKSEIRQLARQKNACIMAHYYVDGAVQDVADFIGDSLALAQQAAKTDAEIIVLCGVHFMGETAAILCPDKKVLVPDPAATCSLAESCQPDEFKAFVEAHPDHIVVSYVNTSAAIKALTDVVVTSSNAKQIVESLPADKPIIFGPDQNLGSYINAITGRQMLLWNGACHVHSRFSVEKILQLKAQHPGAKVLVHPEYKGPVIKLADKVGSTAALLKFAIADDATEFIVATESGILHEMQKKAPHKTFIPAPPDIAPDAAPLPSSAPSSASGCVRGGISAESPSCSPSAPSCPCNQCEYMKLVTLQKLRDCLLNEAPQVTVAPEIAEKAIRPINRMLEISAKLGL